GLDLLHDRGGRLHGEAAAAVFLGDERGEKSGFGQRLHELGRVGALAIECAPILGREFSAQRSHGTADLADRPRVGCLAREHHTGSQLNTSPERSSGVNEGAKAPLSCWSSCSGVQPSERCIARIGRGWLNRKISLRRTPKICPEMPSARSEAR